ncbi:MAG: nitrilase-related carbon-nitrogen hydrolase, partial [Gammaproteobacteria bacterium]
GADFLCVPSAFTRVTGEAHWHNLLRARAIENTCYVFAPAQTGTHQDGRKTYGHSLIIDPWGEILADAGTDVGYVVADIDRTKVAEARSRVPSIHHDRGFMLD